ncbi:hypothetical protein NQ318_020491 [Aromia moschata]|uniref:DUF4817 domain-containing protein n=1 Tax=Aromia moschata TaxID=1265417 RepID=A0AAV8YBA0_9CUCU|nr:hypothetical protein NQ318_020491 [Aromia moschata]
MALNMAHLSERQRIEILMIYVYGNRKRTQSEVCTVFNGIYPYTPVSQGTVCQLMNKFRETGNVKDVKRTGKPKSETSEEKALNVLLTMEETPQVSTREVADNLEINHSGIWCNLCICSKSKTVKAVDSKAVGASFNL